jgi:murein DD-endopeptidase MepM/ murein hydrolase activator NlpD
MMRIPRAPLARAWMLTPTLALPLMLVLNVACTTAQTQEPPAPDADAMAHALHELQERHLGIPVQGVRPDQLSPSFKDPRTGHVHEALDIPAARGTPVLAVDDGTIEKLFLSKPGGNTIYQFDKSRRFAYYYAHLDRYADGLQDRQKVKRGDVIGYVGSTGNASPTNPHLHFGIFLLTPERQWWKGTALDPYPLLRGESGSR